MIKIRKSEERGHANHGWLDSHHTFSFANYYDPQFMGFRNLRVINEDFIAASQGFGTHPHRDMEIITYVVSGKLTHKDSMGTEASIIPGEVQRMTAGTGVRHSEYNGSSTEELHLMQIWIQPRKLNNQPGYDQKNYTKEIDENDMVLVVSKDGRKGSISIDQNVDLYVSKLKKDREVNFELQKNHGAWLQLIKGELNVNGNALNPGDALYCENESLLKIKANSNTEYLLFDLE